MIADRESAWHLYPLRIRPELLKISRDEVIIALKKRAWAASVHFIPLHLHPYYGREFGYRAGDLPRSEAEYKRYLSLPLFPGMRDRDIDTLSKRCSTSSLPPSSPAWLPDSQLINGRSTTNRAFYANSGKRLMDIFCSSLALLLTFPLLILVALAVRLSSQGPVVFRQKRVGKHGEIFNILKFRSMVADAPKCGPEITRAGDERVTGVGAILRKTKLDELPQFWNVLRGDIVW